MNRGIVPERPGAVSRPLQPFLLYFLRLGALGFGGPIALAGYMQRDLVEDRRWISREEYLEGLALAQLAPGPLAGSHHSRLHRLPGRLAAWRDRSCPRRFLPCYLFVIVPAPYFRKFAKNPQLKAFVDGVTAAATGAIAGAAFVRGKRALVDLPAVLIAVATLIALLTLQKIPEPFLILAAGITGLLLHKGVHRQCFPRSSQNLDSHR